MRAALPRPHAPRSGACSGRGAPGSRSAWRSARCSRRTPAWRARATPGGAPAPPRAAAPPSPCCESRSRSPRESALRDRARGQGISTRAAVHASGCGHSEALPRAVASPHWVSIGLLLHRPNCSCSGWGNAIAASIQTQWGNATAQQGSMTLVAASLGVCSQPHILFAKAARVSHTGEFKQNPQLFHNFSHRILEFNDDLPQKRLLRQQP